MVLRNPKIHFLVIKIFIKNFLEFFFWKPHGYRQQLSEIEMKKFQYKMKRKTRVCQFHFKLNRFNFEVEN